MSSIDNPIGDLPLKHRGAILDDAHIGHINGALGTILYGDIAPRLGWGARLKTLLAILGPGLIVMMSQRQGRALNCWFAAEVGRGAAPPPEP
jgi:hypothetical protein